MGRRRAQEALELCAYVGPAPLLAKSQDDGSFSIHKLLAGLNRRERIVQFCAGVMCLALFILCKKFNEDPE